METLTCKLPLIVIVDPKKFNSDSKYVVQSSGIPVTETQTDTEMIDICKTHTETNTEKKLNTDTIYIQK